VFSVFDTSQFLSLVNVAADYLCIYRLLPDKAAKRDAAAPAAPARSGNRPWGLVSPPPSGTVAAAMRRSEEAAAPPLQLDNHVFIMF
jgi:hypothetical protein